MRNRLLGPEALPQSELSACALDGDVFTIGDGWASTAEPDDAGLRALAFIAMVNGRQLIAERLTAAWIWGARSRPPRPLQVCVASTARRSRSFGSATIVRESALRADSDVRVVAGASVTSKERTVLDLLREPGVWSPASAEAVAGLFMVGADRADVAATLANSAPLPYRRLGQRRLAQIELEERLDPVTSRRG
jgi:hypothetical protein